MNINIELIYINSKAEFVYVLLKTIDIKYYMFLFVTKSSLNYEFV